MENKKKVERFYRNEFFRLMQIKPKDVQDGEAPDFIVDLNQIQVGVEITGFHSDLKGETGHPRRLIEEAWAKLQRAIMEEVEKHHELEKTNGLLYFRSLEIPSKPECRQ